MPHSLPGSYSEMYPSRFLKADMFKGKKITLTIASIVGDDLIGEDSKSKQEWVVKFKERQFEFVLNKTNAFCLYRMFGGDPNSWIGHRITMYPTTTRFGRNTVDCIRIWGSPDISEDLEITVPQGRKKAWETVMHKVAEKSAAAVAVNLDPRILAAFEVLGWAETERTAFLATAGSDQSAILTKLNAFIDERDAAEMEGHP